jgi:hypothetical protein
MTALLHVAAESVQPTTVIDVTPAALTSEAN